MRGVLRRRLRGEQGDAPRTRYRESHGRHDNLLERAPVAQLDRATASGAVGHRFESCSGAPMHSLRSIRFQIVQISGWRPSSGRRPSTSAASPTDRRPSRTAPAPSAIVKSRPIEPVVDFLPRQRRRDAGVLAGARAVGGRQRLAEDVLQVVDVDALARAPARSARPSPPSGASARRRVATIWQKSRPASYGVPGGSGM